MGIRNLEIHEYMNLKGQFVLNLLKLSGALTEDEIDEIRIATSSAKRSYPIKTGNLVLREFIITDVQGLTEAKLCKTMGEAQKLAIEIIQDAGNGVRRRMELAIFLEEGEKTKMIGRVGMRFMERGSGTVDGELMKMVGKLLDELAEGEEIMIFYFLFNPEVDVRGLLDEALEAFLPASAKIMGHKLQTALEGQERNGELKKLDKGTIKNGGIYQVVEW